MSTLTGKLKDAFDCAKMTTVLGVFSVASVGILQNAMESSGTPLNDLLVMPSICALAAATGVSAGNRYVQDSSVLNAVPHFAFSTVFGFLAGIASSDLAASPYITAFVAAGAGIALRRNFSTQENVQDQYDHFEY